MSNNQFKPTLRLRANACENVKGIISCEATVEVVDELKVPLESMSGWRISEVGLQQDFIAQRIESQLSRLHTVLRQEGYKLAVDGETK